MNAWNNPNSDDCDMWILKIVAARRRNDKKTEEHAIASFLEVILPLLISWAERNTYLIADAVSPSSHRIGLPSIICEMVFSGVIDHLLDRLDQYDPYKGKSEAWMYQLVVNFWKDTRRKHTRWQKRHLQLSDKDEDWDEWLVGIDDGLFEAAISKDPDWIIAETEELQLMRERIERLYQAAQHDPEMIDVLDIIIAGCEPSPRFIAEAMGISISEVNNRLKRLRRLAKNLK